MLVVFMLTVGDSRLHQRENGIERERASAREITCYCPNAVQEVPIQILHCPGYSSV